MPQPRRCWGAPPPPPADRYVGLTGYVRCFLVTETRTFVPDAHGVTTQPGVRDKPHHTYGQFHTPAGLPALAASTLRGMVRGVFEAATNACFIHAALDARYGGLPVGALVPRHLHPCTRADRLCPACRVFGWVAAQAAPGGSAPARASRVRFSDAVFGADAVDTPARPETLAVLSGPKPRHWRFYLVDGQGRALEGPTARDGYVPGNRIRGRKVYREHDPVTHGVPPAGSDQNRTIRNWLKPGARSGFRACFENLAPVELGALLWALEPDEDCVHRVGYAKPLGYGCVSVQISGLRLAAADRYGALPTAAAWQPRADALDGVEALRTLFRAQMVQRYAPPADAGAVDVQASFLALENVADMVALLGGTLLHDPVRYPSREWFKGESGARRALPLATAPDPGLEL